MSGTISVNDIKKNLNTDFVGKKIFHYNTHASTNIAAKENASEPDGTVFIAEHQTNGRGRLSRSWNSEASGGIYTSILLKPEIPVSDVSQLTLVAGIAAASAINKISATPAFIKWPNDIILNNKKVCGILTELSFSDIHISHAVVGIGINVNNTGFPSDLEDKATSLLIENKKEFDRSDILSLLLSDFEKYYKIFLKSGFPALLNDYSSLCITTGREVRIITPNSEYNAIADSISTDGNLIINKDGELIAVNSGEVSVRGVLGYL